MAPTRTKGAEAVAIGAAKTLPQHHRPYCFGARRCGREFWKLRSPTRKVREDQPLAELLVQLDLDTPIPSEAIVAVAEILAKVYEADQSAASSDLKGLR